MLQGCLRRGGRCSGRCGGWLAGDGSQGIALGHAAIAARAFDVRSAHIVVGQDLGGGRHGDAGFRLISGWRGGRRSDRGVRRCRWNGLDGDRAGLRRCFGIDDRDDFVGDDSIAVGFQQLHDHAGAWRRQFQDHLVGLDVDHVFVARDGFADFLVPRQQGCFSNGFRQNRYLDFDLCHFLKLQ